MLKVVIKTEVPKDCLKARYSEFMTLQRIQTDFDGRMKVLITFKSINRYRHTIIKNHRCKLVKALLDSGVLILYAQVRRDAIIWTLACTWDDFRNLLSNLNDLNLDYEVIWKSSFLEDKKLSHKEFEAIKLALEHGYFENPKKIKLRDLARMLNVSEATASSLIRRALRKVVEHVVNTHTLKFEREA